FFPDPNSASAGGDEESAACGELYRRDPGGVLELERCGQLCGALRGQSLLGQEPQSRQVIAAAAQEGRRGERQRADRLWVRQLSAGVAKERDNLCVLLLTQRQPARVGREGRRGDPGGVAGDEGVSQGAAHAVGRAQGLLQGEDLRVS